MVTIHFAAAGPHLKEWRPAGLFMIASGVAQLVWALWVARAPSRLVVVVFVKINLKYRCSEYRLQSGLVGSRKTQLKLVLSMPEMERE